MTMTVKSVPVNGMMGVMRAGALLAALTLAMLASVVRGDVPPVPETPAPIVRLVEARPFALEASFMHQWRREQPTYRSGWLLVLQVDPALVFPRQTEEPVLYVGGQTAQRLNIGDRSGYVVALVPVEDMRRYRLAEQRIWFGTPAFPEQVDAARIEAEQVKAKQAGIAPLGEEAVEQAVVRAERESLERRDVHALMPDAGRLVERFAPEDKAIAEQLQGKATLPAQ